MGLLNKAGPWLAKMHKKAGTDPVNETIVYTRKSGGATVNLTGKAWVGNTLFARNPNEGGAAVVHGDRDYLVPVADLALAGVPFEPERGDLIAHTAAGVTVTFEVKAQTGEPEKRYSDNRRITWRIHCIEVVLES
jgi:hypothetical protein